MFGFLGTRKSADPEPVRGRLVGIDLTASRARAVSSGDGRTRALELEADSHELPLFLDLSQNPPAVGAAAVRLLRRQPHLVCSNFLPLLGQPHEWRVGRKPLTPTDALRIALDVLRPTVAAETAAAGLTLPVYLSDAQVKRVMEQAAAVRLPVRGSAAAPLALVAHRAAAVVGARAIDPASVLVLDADEFALSGTLLAVSPGDVRVVGTAHWPNLSARLWRERLIDGVSDRCVRLCRRDPRDTATAEQAIYDHLDDAMDAARQGQKVTFHVRAEHWFQDIALQPDEVEGYCGGLVTAAVEGLRQLVQDGGSEVPFRAVWLTHAAGRLPGLAARIYRSTPEQTTVSILPANAAAEAAAALVHRWQTGTLPRGHSDAVVPFDRPPQARIGGKPSAAQIAAPPKG